MSDTVEYRVGIGARRTHHFDLEARFPTGGRSTIDLLLPVWTPGSYLIREYERHVTELRCHAEDGRELPVRKVEKARWRVTTGGARTVVCSYRVYAHEVTVRTSHLDDTHAYWNGATLFLYVEHLRGAPASITVADLPAGWRITTALAADPESPARLRAADHDELVDSPVEIGDHPLLEFEAAGRPHTIALWGRATFDRDRLVTDVRAIIETQARLFGGLPYDRYTFLLHFVPGGYGGLEHRLCASVLTSPTNFADDKKYGDFLELVSHEFFHLWNGKRIRPAALGPFDYQAECHTRSLWVVEGWTSYYDRLLLRRSGRIDAARFRDKLGEDLTRLHRIPGRRHQSLEESSWDAWIKLYRPDENNVNSTVSYYLKGGVVAMLLDLEIRRRTTGARSLDDALRALWQDFSRGGAGYADEALQRVVEAATGLDLEDFFARAVRGRDDLEVEGPLASVGLALKRTSGIEASDREGAWLGASTRGDGGRLRVTEALDGSPAQLGGLSPGDELLAWDGFRLDDDGLRDRLRGGHAGDRVHLTVFRRDQLTDVEVVLARRPSDRIEVVPLPDAPEAARVAYAAWLDDDWKA